MICFLSAVFAVCRSDGISCLFNPGRWCLHRHVHPFANVERNRRQQPLVVSRLALIGATNNHTNNQSNKQQLLVEKKQKKHDKHTDWIDSSFPKKKKRKTYLALSLATTNKQTIKQTNKQTAEQFGHSFSDLLLLLLL